MEEKNKRKLDAIMKSLEKNQEVITQLTLKRDRLFQKFKDTLPGENTMKIVK